MKYIQDKNTKEEKYIIIFTIVQKLFNYKIVCNGLLKKQNIFEKSFLVKMILFIISRLNYDFMKFLDGNDIIGRKSTAYVTQYPYCILY